MEKLGLDYYCFHDRDVAPEGKNLKESHSNLDAIVEVLKKEQDRTGIKLLWGTANLFSNPRYMHGAAPVAMRMSSPTPPLKSRRRSKSPRNWAERIMCSGVAEKVTRRCTTPT